MIRRLKKVTSQAELQQLIEAGIIVSPYIAFDSSSNVTNMVLPAEREISEIEYEQEVEAPVKIVGQITPEYYVESGYIASRLHFVVNAEEDDVKKNIVIALCEKDHFDYVCSENDKSTREEMIQILIQNVFSKNYKTFDPQYVYATKWSLNDPNEPVLEKGILRAPLYPWGEDVYYTTNDASEDDSNLLWVPYDNSYSGHNTYYIFAGYYQNSSVTADEIDVYQLAEYRIAPYLSDSSTFVTNGVHVIGYNTDASGNELSGNYRNVEIRVPANTLYDSVLYNWYLGSEYDASAAADALADREARSASIDLSTGFGAYDWNAPEYINETGETQTGSFAIQLYNSTTGAASDIRSWALMYVEAEGESEPYAWADNFSNDGTDTTFNINYNEETYDENYPYLQYAVFYQSEYDDAYAAADDAGEEFSDDDFYSSISDDPVELDSESSVVTEGYIVEYQPNDTLVIVARFVNYEDDRVTDALSWNVIGEYDGINRWWEYEGFSFESEDTETEFYSVTDLSEETDLYTALSSDIDVNIWSCGLETEYTDYNENDLFMVVGGTYEDGVLTGGRCVVPEHTGDHSFDMVINSHPDEDVYIVARSVYTEPESGDDYYDYYIAGPLPASNIEWFPVGIENVPESGDTAVIGEIISTVPSWADMDYPWYESVNFNEIYQPDYCENYVGDQGVSDIYDACGIAADQLICIIGGDEENTILQLVVNPTYSDGQLSGGRIVDYFDRGENWMKFASADVSVGDTIYLVGDYYGGCHEFVLTGGVTVDEAFDSLELSVEINSETGDTRLNVNCVEDDFFMYDYNTDTSIITRECTFSTHTSPSLIADGYDEVAYGQYRQDSYDAAMQEAQQMGVDFDYNQWIVDHVQEYASPDTEITCTLPADEGSTVYGQVFALPHNSTTDDYAFDWNYEEYYELEPDW